MSGYRTAGREARAELIVEKSRFIAHVSPVETREEAESYIAVVRASQREATHNVPAMVLGDKFQIQWASDDGEPQGTAGAPIVHMLVKEGITNVVVVVTRYFGGVKLGTGGLVRAYTGSAKLGLEAAGICEMRDTSVLTVKLDYTYLSKAQNAAANGNFDIKEILYEDKVTLKIAAKPEDADDVKKRLSDISSGGFVLISEHTELVKTVDSIT